MDRCFALWKHKQTVVFPRTTPSDFEFQLGLVGFSGMQKLHRFRRRLLRIVSIWRNGYLIYWFHFESLVLEAHTAHYWNFDVIFGIFNLKGAYSKFGLLCWVVLGSLKVNWTFLVCFFVVIVFKRRWWLDIVLCGQVQKNWV